EPHQHHPRGSRQGDDRRSPGRSEEMADARQSHDHRSATGRGCEVNALRTRCFVLGLPSRSRAAAKAGAWCWVLGAGGLVLGAWCAVLSAQTAVPDRPAVGADRPFQLAARIERTLPNGLRVIVTKQAAVPKMTAMLTVLSGYSSDPPAMTGLANLTAEVVQEGTKTKNSRQIRREVFGMGGSLSATVSQDYSTLTVRGLSEFAPQLIGMLADVAMNPTLPADEIAILEQQHLQ